MFHREEAAHVYCLYDRMELGIRASAACLRAGLHSARLSMISNSSTHLQQCQVLLQLLGGFGLLIWLVGSHSHTTRTSGGPPMLFIGHLARPLGMHPPSVTFRTDLISILLTVIQISLSRQWPSHLEGLEICENTVGADRLRRYSVRTCDVRHGPPHSLLPHAAC